MSITCSILLFLQKREETGFLEKKIKLSISSIVFSCLCLAQLLPSEHMSFCAVSSHAAFVTRICCKEGKFPYLSAHLFQGYQAAQKFLDIYSMHGRSLTKQPVLWVCRMSKATWFLRPAEKTPHICQAMILGETVGIISTIAYSPPLHAFLKFTLFPCLNKVHSLRDFPDLFWNHCVIYTQNSF